MADFINTIDVLGDNAVVDSIINKTITEFKDDQITGIKPGAFYGCTALTEIAFPNVTNFLGDHNDPGAFAGCTAFTEITDKQFPALTSLTNYAFYKCNAITTVSLTNVTTIAWFAVTSDVLENVYLPNLRTIGMNGFQAKFSALKRLVLPSLKHIDKYGIAGAWYLEYMDCASTSEEVLTINGTANFNYATSLTTFIIRSSSVAELGGAVFNDNPIASGTGYIYVPAALVEDYKAATNWSTYADQIRALEDYTVDGTVTGELDETKI